jgi:hypothetical protein
VEAARIPVTFDSDQDAVETAILTSGAVTAETCRLVWVKNTLKLDQFIASEALLDDIRSRDNLKVLEDLGELAFTKQGNLSNLL